MELLVLRVNKSHFSRKLCVVSYNRIVLVLYSILRYMKGQRSGEGNIPQIFPAGNRIPEGTPHVCCAVCCFYIFCRQECIATPNSWSGIEMYIVSR